MLHTKFRRNRPAGSTEEYFRRIFTIYGSVGHIGHVTSIMLSDSHFLVPKKLSYKIWFRSAQQFLRKIQFEFLYVHDLGPRSRNDLDLQYSHIFRYSTKLQITGCNSF